MAALLTITINNELQKQLQQTDMHTRIDGLSLMSSVKQTLEDLKYSLPMSPMVAKGAASDTGMDSTSRSPPQQAGNHEASAGGLDAIAEFQKKEGEWTALHVAARNRLSEIVKKSLVAYFTQQRVQKFPALRVHRQLLSGSKTNEVTCNRQVSVLCS